MNPWHRPLRPLEKTLLLAYALGAPAYLLARGFLSMGGAPPAWAWALLAAEAVATLSLLAAIRLTWNLSPGSAAPGAAKPGSPSSMSLDVYVTTLNEDLELLRETLARISSLRHPHRLYVLDDGRRPEVRALAGELGAETLWRIDRAGAKAGNLNHALSRTSGELIAFFDADGFPRADFLERALPAFRDPAVALVQAPQTYYNTGSLQFARDGRWHAESVFWDILQPGRDAFGSAQWCGTGAVIRREALERIGGVAGESVTEDFETSLRLHAAGYRSAYLSEPIAYCRAAECLRGFLIQRNRWAQGTFQALRAGWRELLLPGRLSRDQRLLYLGSGLYYLAFAHPPLVALAMAAYACFGVSPVDVPTPWLPAIALKLAADLACKAVYSRGRARPLRLLSYELFTCLSFPAAAIQLLAVRRLPFRVTPKGRAAGGGAVPWQVFLILGASAAGAASALARWISGSTGDTPAALVVAGAVCWVFAALALQALHCAFASRAPEAGRRRSAAPVGLPALLGSAD